MSTVEKVVIREELATGGHYVGILGREYPGAPRSVLRPDGSWQPLIEAEQQAEDAWWRFPEGALEALVAAAGETAPQPATARHLDDAIAVRDRTLALVERIVDADIARESNFKIGGH